MEKILEHLYYLKPLYYVQQISGPDDPHEREITKQSIAFEKHLADCPFKEYCMLIVKAFKDTYPDTPSLKVSLLGSEEGKPNIRPDLPLRAAEISRIDFTYNRAKMKGRCDPDTVRNLQYLEECKVTFKLAQPQLAAWVAEALQGKPFVQSYGGNKTVFTVHQSPILKIEVKAKEMAIFIDKNAFIEYNYQRNAYWK